MKLRAPGLWAASLIFLLAAPVVRAAEPEKAAAPPSAVEILNEPAAGAPAGPATSAGGRITVEKPIMDAGDVVRGKPATAVFEIKNTGSGPLKILSAKPG